MLKVQAPSIQRQFGNPTQKNGQMMTVPEMITFATEYFDNFHSLNYYTSRNVAPDGAVDGYSKTWYNEFINVSPIDPPFKVKRNFSVW